VPDYLYTDEGPENYVQYVFNVSVLRASLKKLAGIDLVRQEELGRLHNWNDAYRFGCRQIEVEEARFRRVGSIFNHHKTGTYARNLETNFMALVDEYPGITFYALIPPYSAQWLRSIRSYNPFALNDYLGFRHYLAGLRRPNLKVFDFMSDEKVVTDGTHYRDLAHYSESINEMMFRRMYNGEHLPVMEHVDMMYADKPMKCH
jgi:hypothetical protein